MSVWPFQHDGAAFLASRPAALLADDCGLGKSVQLIRACDRARVLRVLILCPASVVENWRREIARWKEGDWDAVVMSFDMAAGSAFASLMADSFDVLIVDEAHMLKSPTAKRTKAVYGAKMDRGADSLASRATYVWLATATPMPNNPSELYPHLRALAPQLVTSERTNLPWTFMQFVNAYCAQKSNGFGMQIVGSRNEAALHAKLAGFMLRRKKADVLRDLPPLSFTELYLDGDVTGLDHPDAEKIRAVLAERGADGLQSIQRNGGVAALRRLTGLAKAVPAAEWVADWLDSNPPEKKLVVFAHHHDVLETIYDRLYPRAVRVAGYVKTVERQKAVDRMQGDPSVRVFLGQITAAGVGITLTAASELLFVESSWVPAEMEQAAQRIHRIGQTEPCLVRFATLAGSIDEDIQRALARKMSSIGKVVDGVTA